MISTELYTNHTGLLDNENALHAFNAKSNVTKILPSSQKPKRQALGNISNSVHFQSLGKSKDINLIEVPKSKQLQLSIVKPQKCETTLVQKSNTFNPADMVCHGAGMVEKYEQIDKVLERAFDELQEVETEQHLKCLQRLSNNANDTHNTEKLIIFDDFSKTISDIEELPQPDFSDYSLPSLL